MSLASVVVLAAIPAAWSATERAVAREITGPAILARIRFLAHDLLEGRAPGERGSEVAMAYVASEYERLGLRTSLQRFEIVGVRARLASPPAFRGPRGSFEPASPSEAMVIPAGQGAASAVRDAEVVFCGYGITAPEQGWDDFKGVDVRGKVLLVMNSDPAADPALFAGRTRLYYGRWTYKFEEAERRGAAAVVLIHTDASAGYPWQVVQTSWSGEKIELPASEPPRTQVQMWLTEAAARRVATLGGADLDELRRRAERRDFAPVPLGVTLSVALENQVRRTESANVLGVLPGSDPALAGEMVVVTAHHDHLGMGAGSGDRIHNGALDNASGVGSMLALAEAVARHARPKRSILFAAVGAEESGLLGSAYLAKNPPVPPGKLVAGFNLDGMNIWGRTRDVEIPGLGKTTLDAVVAPLARAQGRHLVPDQEPDRGAFYRSDHFSLAKIGVPALSFGGGQDYVGRPAGWGKAQQDAWVARHYHQPSDEVDPGWNLDGMVEDIQLVAAALLRVADRREPPRWAPGDEFEAAWRKARATPAGSSRPSRP